MSNFSAEKVYALFETTANKKIIAELTSIGAKTILFPTVEPEEIDDLEINKISDIPANFDWLIFPDIYTVEFFLQKLATSDFDLFELDVLRVCAFGESVADRLRFAQLHADVIPNTIKTPDVWEALKNYLIDESEFENLRFLILKKENSNVEITNELKNQNADATELEIYRMLAGEDSEIAKLKALLQGGAVDEFIFTSPFDVLNLAHLFPNENLVDVLSEIKLTATDKIALQSLEEFRLS